MEQRPLTPRERQTLTEIPPPTPALPLAWHIAMGSFGATGCLAGMLLLTLGAFFGTFNLGGRVATTATLAIAGLAVITATLSTRLRYSIERRRQLHDRAQIDADLRGGTASVERHQATAALRAILEDRRERAYFMRLADGRAMFIGYWRPKEEDDAALVPGLPEDLPTYPCSEFEIARGPSCGIVLSVTFLGATLPVSETLDPVRAIRRPMPGVGQIAPVPWEDLRKTYG